MKENKVTVKAYRDAIEKIAGERSRCNFEYFSVREIEPLLGVEVIPTPDELFEALEQLGLEHRASICSTDRLVYLESRKINQELQERLSRLKTSGFYLITHIDNLYSIFQEGLLCKNLVKEKGLKYLDLSDSEVQDRRDNKVVGGLNLHLYVPLYFAHQNSMTHKVIRNHNVSELCFICVSKEILSINDVYFSDGNAAADKSNFYKVDGEFEILYEILENVKNTKSWGKHDAGKRIRCAEVLVPYRLPTSMFKSIVTYNKIALRAVENSIWGNVNVRVDRSFFDLK